MEMDSNIRSRIETCNSLEEAFKYVNNFNLGLAEEVIIIRTKEGAFRTIMTYKPLRSSHG